MMTLDQIKELVAAGESETLEFKSNTKKRREAAQTMCAMLNHRGGRVLFGVTPAGNVSGQQVSDRTNEEVSAEIQRIDPPVFPAVERIPVRTDREVIAVSVGPGYMKPYTYKGAAYRRVGNTTLCMSRDAQDQMLIERVQANSAGRINLPLTGRLMTLI